MGAPVDDEVSVDRLAVGEAMLRRNWDRIAPSFHRHRFFARSMDCCWNQEFARMEVVIEYAGFGARESHLALQREVRASVLGILEDFPGLVMVWAQQDNG